MLPPGATLNIEPADQVLVIRNGVPETLSFTAVVRQEGYPDEIVTPVWRFENAYVGSIGSDGDLTIVLGFVGAAKLRATFGGVTTTTGLTVRTEDTLLGEGVASDVPAKFAENPTSGAGSPTLLYPLDEAVMPRSIKPVHTQWEVGNAGDFYRVVVSSEFTNVTAYLSHSGATFGYDWLVPDAQWDELIRAASGSEASFVVDRWDSSTMQTLRSSSSTVSIVNANLNGAIYYWDINAGKILRITDKDGREDFMPSPPKNPRNPVNRCVACHAVSNDGELMAVEMWGGNGPGAIFDLGDDLSVDPAPTYVAPGKYKANFSTFNEDATRLMVTVTNGVLRVVDTATGEYVTTMGTPLPTTGASHPSWSPDGTRVVYIANMVAPSWELEFTLGDVAILPVTAIDTFGTTSIIRAADGKTNSWPSFSPDSDWVAYGRGGSSLGYDPGSLRLIKADGTGTEIDLAKANGSGENSHVPNFSPFDEGGYNWLVFNSIRDYGNAQVGTKGDDRRRQLWVTAISNDPQSGVDPSNVPYWLPDQDVETSNVSAYWTKAPPIVGPE